MVIGLFIAIFALIFLSSIPSMADISYATVNQLRLKKEIKEHKSKRAKLALKLAENYDDTVTIALFSNNLINIAASSLTAVLAHELFRSSQYVDLAVTISSIILLLLLLIFGEILPKVLGRVFSYKCALTLAYPIIIVKYMFFPIIFIASNLGTLIARIFVRDKKKDDEISNEELQEMVDTIEDEGVIDKDQKELLNNAIEFKDTEAHEIMTPRVKMVAFDSEDNIVDLIQSDDVYTHSRIPVYKETIDNIIGILPIKTLLRKLLANEAIDINELIVPAEFVPGSMGISEILDLMQKTKNHIVIVKDEYGGTDGILTMEDILEELVGDMWDEFDKVEEPYKKIKKGVYEVNGSMNVDDLFTLIDVDLPSDADYETVGGFIMDKLERFAKVGDKIKYENVRFEVLNCSDYNVDKVLVRVGKRKENA